ncbi:MAG: cyclase family protein [Dehalococcoidia bacterium]
MRDPDDGVPTFAELSVRLDAPPNSSWGVFGEADQLGTVNFLTPERVVAAASLVKAGRVFSLNWSLLLPFPPLFGRQPLKHRVGHWPDRMIVDDVIHNFYPQVSSQWDSLRHAGHAEYGFYNGFSIQDVAQREGGPLGIDNLARRGIVGRGVLLDVYGHMRATNRPFSSMDVFVITAELLAETAEWESVDIKAGDILLVRTGWIAEYLALTPNAREELAARTVPGSGYGSFTQAGLGGTDLPEFLWNHRIAAIAADNPAFDTAPSLSGGRESLHATLIGLLGMPLGEMWQLEDLARDCAQDQTYEFFLTSAPLNIPGGAGSPPNALAIK